MIESGRTTVLMTGGAGFIGCALSTLIDPSAHRLVVLDNLHPQVHRERTRPAALAPHAELVIGDVTDSATWDAVLADARPEIVILLAAETGTAQSLHEASRHAEVNVLGTTRMLDALGRIGHVPSHIILSSSRAVYGEGRWQRASGEIFQPGQRSHARLAAGQWDFPDAQPLPSSAASTVPAPTSIYGATKLATEHLLRVWTSSYDTALTILRLQNVYGPGQSLINQYTGIVSLFSQLAQRGEVIPLYEDGEITRDFAFIDDVARAFAEVIDNGPRDSTATFDIGSGVATTIRELAETIATYHGAPTPVVTGGYRDGDVRSAQCRIDETLAALDWQPQIELGAGIAALQEWIERSMEESAEGVG